MTDAALHPTAPPAAHRPRFQTTEAQALLRKRYAAERRFRLYGLSAIGFAAAFIVFLVGDIVIKAMPAFFEHRLTVELTATAERVADGGKTDRDTLAAGDWMAVVRDGVGKYFPEVTGRSQRSKLYNELISAGAGTDIRDRVMADATLIGKPVKASVLLSDDADLYFKGHMTARAERSGRGALGVSGVTAR
jgi:phosphate transport system permease protein